MAVMKAGKHRAHSLLAKFTKVFQRNLREILIRNKYSIATLTACDKHIRQRHQTCLFNYADWEGCMILGYPDTPRIRLGSKQDSSLYRFSRQSSSYFLCSKDCEDKQEATTVRRLFFCSDYFTYRNILLYNLNQKAAKVVWLQISSLCNVQYVNCSVIMVSSYQ